MEGARSRRLKGHAPVELAIGVTAEPGCAAEMEIHVSRVTDRPAAVVPFKGGDSFGSLRFLGHLSLAGQRAGRWEV